MGSMMWRAAGRLRRLLTRRTTPEPGIPEEKPIIVHSMKKVGSSTITQALREAGHKCYKCHYLSPRLSAEAERWFSDMGKPRPRWLQQDERFRAQLGDWRRARREAGMAGKCRVITLIRDPVAVNLSVLFTTMGTIFPDFSERFRAGEIGLPEIEDYLLEVLSGEGEVADPIVRYLRGMFDLPLRWFEVELKAVFGVDVLAEEFPREGAYRIYHGQDAEVLLIKCEHIDGRAAEALRDFLQVEAGALKRRNTAEEKPYHQAYARFKEVVALPARILERCYASPYVTHCCSAAEIDGFRKGWSKPPQSGAAAPARAG